MRELNKIAEDLFEKIRGRFEDVSLGDENAKATHNPEDARFFNFDYEIDGHNYGNITVSIIDEMSLKIYFSRNISRDLDEQEQKQWYIFLRELRHFAKRNLLTFEPRDITRSTLKIRDIKQVSKDDSTYSKTDTKHLGEGRMYGTLNRSYESFGPVRIKIAHSKPVMDEANGARSRNIQSIYVENEQFERFKLPFNSLTGARAMARHISAGGVPSDEFGQHITEMVSEMMSLRPFVNQMRHRTFEDATTQAMIESAFGYHRMLKQTLGKLKGKKGYTEYKANYQPALIEDDVNVDDLKEKFVKKIYDDRISNALPIVHKAYNVMKEYAPKESATFESWATRLSEGTWAVPETEEQIEELKDLLSNPLPAGVDGENATGALYNLIGDDKLFDEIADVAKDDPNQDVSELVTYWLQENMPEVYQQLVSDIGDDPNYPPEQMEEESIEEDMGDDQTQEIADMIIHRIKINAKEHSDLILKLGPDGIIDAAEEVASFYSPMEEIGSSDVGAMIRSLYRYAGMEYKMNETEKAVPGDSTASPLTHTDAGEAYCDACDRVEKECVCEEVDLEVQLAEDWKKWAAGAALAGALGTNAYMDKQSYDASPQLKQLQAYHQMAVEKGDTAKAKELERRIEDHKARLSLGKGDVAGPDGEPKKVQYEDLENPQQTNFNQLTQLAKKGYEGIVILGAGGSPNEWTDGIFELLQKEGITKAQSIEEVFEDAMLLKTTGGRTDLAMVFTENADLEMGKLAMWRLRFGDCSWISDYVENYAGQHGFDLSETNELDQDLEALEKLGAIQEEGNNELAEMKRLAGLA